MIREVITYPNPLLHQAAEPVAAVDDEVRALLADMAETMVADDGVGLAAPQIGVLRRCVVIDVRDGSGLFKLVNPEIVAREGETEWPEGCLSVPEFTVTMKRSAHVTVRYQNEEGDERTLEADGLLAVALQHEIDHLDGRLIIDSVSRLKQDLYLRKRRKQEQSGEPKKKTFIG